MKMSKSEYDDFLVRGWENDGSLFYNGFIYLSNCYYISEDKHNLFIYKFEAKNNGDGYYSAYVTEHDFKSYEEVENEIFSNYEDAKEAYFKLKIFEGKTFFEVVDEVEWLEDSDHQILVK